MKGYVTQRRGHFYAVIYEGLDPVTGHERRAWHPAGTDRAEAERIAARLAAEREGRDDEVRSLSFGAYLTTQWLPAKKIELAASTYRDYERKTTNHVLPAVGRIGLRRLRPEHLDRLYKAKLRPTDGQRPLAPKTVYEIHLIVRGALSDAVRRGLIQRNVALFARSPLQRSFHQTEKTAWTADQLRSFLRAAAGHKLFPALWLSANTGMRRSELLGLRWADLNVSKARLSINRGLVAVGYELHETPGKTRNARRTIDLDATTLEVLHGWRALQTATYRATGTDDPGTMFTNSGVELDFRAVTPGAYYSVPPRHSEKCRRSVEVARGRGPACHATVRSSRRRVPATDPAGAPNAVFFGFRALRPVSNKRPRRRRLR